MPLAILARELPMFTAHRLIIDIFHPEEAACMQRAFTLVDFFSSFCDLLPCSTSTIAYFAQERRNRHWIFYFFIVDHKHSLFRFSTTG